MRGSEKEIYGKKEATKINSDYLRNVDLKDTFIVDQ